MQDTRAIPTLTAVLKDTQQEPMVRHEAGKHAHSMGGVKRVGSLSNTHTFVRVLKVHVRVHAHVSCSAESGK